MRAALCLVVVLALLVAIGAPLRGDPKGAPDLQLKIGPDAMLMERFSASALEYVRRSLDDAERLLTAPHSAAARAWLGDFAEWYSYRPMRKSAQEIVTSGEAILKSEPSPVLRAAVIEARCQLRDLPDEAVADLAKIVDLPAVAAMPGAIPYRIGRIVSRQAGRAGAEAAAEKLLGKADDAALERLGASSRSEIEERFVLDCIRVCLDRRFNSTESQKFAVSVERSPHPSPWARAILLGDGERQTAWRARGGGLAREVRDDQWPEFFDHMSRARKHFKKAWTLAANRPEAAVSLIECAFTLDDEPEQDVWFWFKEGFAAQPDWIPLYETMEWGLLPRWGGTPEQMALFGMQLMNTARFDTVVPWRGARIAIDAGREMNDKRALLARGELWESFDRTFAGYASTGGQQFVIPAAAKTYRAAAAWRAGRYETALQVLDDVGDGFVLDWGPYFGASRGLIKIDSLVATGPTSHIGMRLISAESDARWDEAIQLAEQALRQLNAPEDPRSAVFRAKRNAADVMKRLEAGETVALPFDRTEPIWLGWKGWWSPDGSGGVTATAVPRGLAFHFAHPIGSRFEMCATLDLSQCATIEGANVGILFKANRNDPDSSMGAVIFPALGEIRVGGNGALRSSNPIRTPPDHVYHLVVSYWDAELVVVKVNDEESYRGSVRRAPQVYVGDYVGIGSVLPQPGDIRPKVKEVGLRRLAERP